MLSVYCFFVYMSMSRGTRSDNVNSCFAESLYLLLLLLFLMALGTASDCKQVLNPSSVRDEVWATQSCTLGFNVAGRFKQ